VVPVVAVSIPVAHPTESVQWPVTKC